MTLIIQNRKEILAAEDIVELSNVFKGIVGKESATDCHQFLLQVFSLPKSIANRLEIEKLRQTVGANGLE